MDKAYTMMYELDKTGKIANTSPLFLYDSVEAINKSFKLKKPDPSLFIKYKLASLNDKGSFIGERLLENEIALPVNLKENELFNTLLNRYSLGTEFLMYTFRMMSDDVENLKGDVKIDFYNDLLLVLKEYSNGQLLVQYDLFNESQIDYFFRLITDLDLSIKLIDDLNKHNLYSAGTPGLKNRIMNGVYNISSDIHNLEASQLLMEMETTLDTMTRVEATSPGKQNRVIYTLLSPITKYKIQQENSVGKDNVGIAANGVKADGAILQHYDYQLHHNKWVPNNLLTDIPLHFNAKTTSEMAGKVLFGKRFVRFANVKMTKELFMQMHLGTDRFTSDNDFIAINEYLNNKWDRLSHQDFYDDYDAKKGEVNHNLSILNPYYLNLLDDWKAYVKQTKFRKKSITEEEYKDFLWFRTLFEDNAADQLSVFISLATDNAKVLALARLNATPELMSLPITMITLGMDMYSVANICINLLDEVASRLQLNRFSGKISTDVREIIQQIGKEGIYDQQTTESLLKVYDLAQELRALTSLYKVNQGVEPRYEKLLAWINGLSRIKLDREKVLASIDRTLSPVSKLSQLSLIKTLDGKLKYEDIIGKPIDFNRLFDNSDYASRLTDYMEDIKVGINYIDIMLHSPNFKALLEGVNFAVDKISNISFIAALSQLLSNGLEEDSEEVIDTQDIIFNEEPSTKKNVYNLNKKIAAIGLHIIVADVIKNLNYTFKAGDIESVFGKLSVPLGLNVVFDFKSSTGVNTIVDLFDNTIIPKLISTYKDNFFMLSLVKKFDYASGKTTWQIKYNAFGTEDKSEAANINQAKLEFEHIMKNSSGLKTIDGKNITIGEVFYLYDIITRKGAISSLNTAVKPGVSLYSDIASLLDSTYRKYDYATQKGEFNNIISKIGADKLNAIVEALKSDSKSAVYNGKQINLTDGWIWTELPFTKALTYPQFEQSIKKAFNESHSGDITLTPRFINGDLEITASIRQYNLTLKYVAVLPDTAGNLSNLNSILLSNEQVKVLTTLILANAGSIIDILTSLPIKNNSSINTILDLKQEFGTRSVIGKVVNSLTKDSQLILIEEDAIGGGAIDRSFIFKYGNEQVAVVKESAIAVRSQYEIIDVLLQLKLSESDQIATEDSKVNTLIKILEPTAVVSSNVTNNINSITGSKRKVIEEYIDYLSNLKIDSNFKQLCLSEINLYANRLLGNPEFYYYKSFTDQSLNIGDKYTKDGITYLYLGQKIGDLHTLVSIDPKNPEVKQVDNSQLWTYKKTAQIKRSPLYVLGLLDPKKYKYSAELTLSLELINISDQVKIPTIGWATVVDIVYDRTKDGYKKLLIVHNSDGFRLAENNKYLAKKSNVSFGQDNISVQSEIEITPELFNVFNPIELLLAGDKVLAKEGEFSFYKLLNELVILGYDANNNLINIPISSIIKLSLGHNINPDPSFTLATQRLEVITTNSELIQVSNISPELFGYDEKKLEGLEASTNSSLNTFVYFDDGWTVRFLNDYERLSEDAEPQAGNIVITKTGDIETCYKILSLNEIDNSLLLLELNSDRKQNVITVPYTFFKNKNIRLYSNDKELLKTKFEFNINDGDETLSMTQKGYKILDHLRDTFGINVLVINDHSKKFFASVDGNTIYINTADTNGYDVGTYIAKLALHEFTHIILAKMLADSPESYFAFIQMVDLLVQTGILDDIALSIMIDPTYKSRTEKLEEVIVRYIENKSYFDINTDETTFILIALTNGFNKLFNIKNGDENIFKNYLQNQNIGLAQLLTNYRSSIFKETTEEGFNINFIENENILLKIYDNIKQIC